jgi:hypothetical protein
MSMSSLRENWGDSSWIYLRDWICALLAFILGVIVLRIAMDRFWMPMKLFQGSLADANRLMASRIS